MRYYRLVPSLGDEASMQAHLFVNSGVSVYRRAVNHRRVFAYHRVIVYRRVFVYGRSCRIVGSYPPWGKCLAHFDAYSIIIDKISNAL